MSHLAETNRTVEQRTDERYFSTLGTNESVDEFVRDPIHHKINERVQCECRIDKGKVSIKTYYSEQASSKF